MEIFKHLFLLFLNSYIIWKACDSFQTASLFLGRKMPAGTRGATINAIGSSFPEFMTSFIAIFNYTENNGAIFGIANTTGSVMYNITMIPFFVIFACYIFKNIDKLHFNKNIIMREGIFLILIQLVLMAILAQGEFNLLNTFILIVIYGIYIYAIFYHAPHKKQNLSEPVLSHPTKPQPVSEQSHHHRLPPKQPLIKALFDVDLFSIFFPKSYMVTAFNAITVLFISIIIFYFTCNALVSSSYALGDILGIPSYLVAITVTAFATSVPDTILSIHDAKNGHFDDAITNAFGSNVFNISFCIAFPILIYILMNGGKSITFEQSSIDTINSFKTITNIIVVFIVGLFVFLNKKWKLVSICLLLSYSLFIYSIYDKVQTPKESINNPQQVSTKIKTE